MWPWPFARELTILTDDRTEEQLRQEKEFLEEQIRQELKIIRGENYKNSDKDNITFGEYKILKEKGVIR